jgi:prepilin-type N-terminal cleavage/methylation domain-containing protein
MKTSHLGHGGSRPAFTLVEIITVIAIILALAAMVIGGLKFVQEKQRTARTKVFIASVSQALEQYRTDHGVFPEGDGETDSTELVYRALSGDGVGPDGIAGNGDDTNPDGETDPDAQVYLPMLNPKNKGKSKNVKETTNGYVLVDAWKSKDDETVYQELFYRHDTNGQDPNMMNPDSDFDLWSLGPDGEGGSDPSGTKQQRADDIKNW